MSGGLLSPQGGGLTGAGLTGAAPADITKAAAAVGVATDAARADHKHDITTAIAVAVGTADAEGSATSLARSDHTHQVTGLMISGQVQGDILYRNATDWVRLPPGMAGQLLQTLGVAADPLWATVSTLTDGDKGDITVTASGATWTIDAAVVTLAKMADIAEARFIGRTTAGVGIPEALTMTTATAMLNAFTPSTKGLAPASSGGTANYLRADGTWAAPPGTPEISGLTTNTITKATSATTIGDSNIRDDGSNIHLDLTARLAGNLFLTQVGNVYILAGLAESTGNQSMNLFAAGNGTIRFNSNTGGVSNAGTGGIALYPGANSSTIVWSASAAGTTTQAGDATINGNVTLGDNVADAHTLTGSLTANGVAGSDGDVMTRVAGVPQWAVAAGGTTTIIDSAAIGAGTTNDWAPGTLAPVTYIKANANSGSATITGLAGGVDGYRVIINSYGASQITILDESGSSTAANRFDMASTSGTVMIGGRQDSLEFVYNGTISRWTEITQTSYPRLYVTGGATINGTTTLAAMTATNTTATGNVIMGDAAGDAHTLTGSLSLQGAAGSDGQVITRSGGLPTWAAASGGLSGLTTNTLTKATSATTIGNSSITDDGTTIIAGAALTTSGSFPVQAGTNGKISLGHGGFNDIGFSYNVNSTQTGFINYRGYLGGTTQFRNLEIHDGKSAQIVQITGSTKAAVFAGAVTVAGVTTLNGNTVLGDAATDTINVVGTLGFSGTDPTISTGSATITGEAQTFQVTLTAELPAASTIVINLNRTFTSAPYCVICGANANSIPLTVYVTATTTQVTITADSITPNSSVFNVFCPDRF